MTLSTDINKQQLLEISHSCLDYNLRKASRIAAQHYEDILKPSGLRNTQFTLLVAATLMDKPLITDLARILVMDRTTVSRNIKPLERDGLLQIVPGQDKRSRQIVLTHLGCQKLIEAIPLWRQAHQTLQEKLGVDNEQGLLAALDNFNKQLNQQAGV
ncbi:MAG TPA: MarR family transcriptional regulator [Crenotrichaceae bacterium]|nr:MarR family transcriptional regulator [Crenotrichaceae bacterium]